MIWILIGLSVFGLDYVIKKWGEKNLAGKKRQQIGKTGFSFLLVHNYGFAGSKMKKNPKLVKKIHTAMLCGFAAICIAAGYFKESNKWTALGLSLILGGGASNLYDRYEKGYVTDYLGLPVAKNLVFNLSDLCIFLGAFLTILGEIKK